MKKVVALLMVATLAFSAIGCGTKDQVDKPVEKGSSNESINSEASGDVESPESSSTPEVEVSEETPTSTGSLPADYDPETYWLDHGEELFYGGDFVISGSDSSTGVTMNIVMEISGDEYAHISMGMEGSMMNMAILGQELYIYDDTTCYRYAASSKEEAEELTGVNTTFDTSGIKYVETVDNKDKFEISGDEEGDTVYIYVDRELGVIDTMEMQDIVFTVEPLTERTFDVNNFSDIQEASDEEIGEILMGFMFGMVGGDVHISVGGDDIQIEASAAEGVEVEVGGDDEDEESSEESVESFGTR